MQPFSSFWAFSSACIKDADDATFRFLHLSPRFGLIGCTLLVCVYLFFVLRNRAGGRGQMTWPEFLVVSLPMAVVVVVWSSCLIRSPYLVYTAELIHAKQEVEQSGIFLSEAENRTPQSETQSEGGQPDLRVSMLTSVMVPASNPDNVVVGVFARVSNSGASGSVADFRVNVKFNDGRVLKGEIAEISAESNTVRLGQDAQGRPLLLATSDYWLNERAAIPRNEFREGFLMALVKGTTVKEIQEKNAAIEFICTDVTGAISSAFESANQGSGASSTLGSDNPHEAIRNSHNKI